MRAVGIYCRVRAWCLGAATTGLVETPYLAIEWFRGPDALAAAIGDYRKRSVYPIRWLKTAPGLT